MARCPGGRVAGGVEGGLANCNWHINHTQRGANSKHVYKFFVWKLNTEVIHEVAT